MLAQRIKTIAKKITTTAGSAKNIIKVRDILYAIATDKNLARTKTQRALFATVRNGIRKRATHAEIYADIANFLLNCGQPELAQQYYLLSLKHACIPATYSLYLQCLLMSPNCSDSQMHKAASQYTHLFLKNVPKYTQHTNSKTARQLKIGYICHFFHNSVSEALLLPFVKAHDRNAVKVYCFSDTTPDEVTDEVRAIADSWHDTKGLSDEKLAAFIKEQEIDILLELNGHCIVNRYGVIARKPAPIQISYYNICATSGVSGFDYILVGDAVKLDRSQSFYTESIYYLKGVAGIANFLDRFPAPAPPPFLKNGYITFGSFGAAHKVNHEVIKLWCAVLKAVPTSRFYMKAGVLSFEDYRKLYRDMFLAEGIDESRFDLEGFSDHQTMLNCYGKMDIALDTFPAQGGTTTMEALWQGVPVVCLNGSRYSYQVGPMILECIKHPELIAQSKEEFVAKATELASGTKLVELREALRKDFAASPLADPSDFARRLEAAYQDMWDCYCQKN